MSAAQFKTLPSGRVMRKAALDQAPALVPAPGVHLQRILFALEGLDPREAADILYTAAAIIDPDLQDEKPRKRGSRGPAPDRALDDAVLACLAEGPQSSIMVARALGKERAPHTVLHILNRLVAEGRVLKTGRTKSTRFHLAPEVRS